MLEFYRLPIQHATLKASSFYRKDDTPRKFSWNICEEDIEDEREDMKLHNRVSMKITDFRYSRKRTAPFSLKCRIGIRKLLATFSKICKMKQVIDPF